MTKSTGEQDDRKAGSNREREGYDTSSVESQAHRQNSAELLVILNQMCVEDGEPPFDLEDIIGTHPETIAGELAAWQGTSVRDVMQGVRKHSSQLTQAPIAADFSRQMVGMIENLSSSEGLGIEQTKKKESWVEQALLALSSFFDLRMVGGAVAFAGVASLAVMISSGEFQQHRWQQRFAMLESSRAGLDVNFPNLLAVERSAEDDIFRFSSPTMRGAPGDDVGMQSQLEALFSLREGHNENVGDIDEALEKLAPVFGAATKNGPRDITIDGAEVGFKIRATFRDLESGSGQPESCFVYEAARGPSSDVANEDSIGFLAFCPFRWDKKLVVLR